MSLLVALVLAQSLNLNTQPILCMDEAAYCRADKLRAFEVNCSGAGITCAQVGGRMTLTVPGGSGGGYDGGKVGEAFAADASISAQVAGVAGVAYSADAAGFASTASVAAVAYSADASVYANALAANPTDCAGGEFANAIDQFGNLTCATPAGGPGGKVAEAYMADASITAQAFEANPSDCSAGQYATTIAANGNLTCAQVAYSQVSGTPTIPADISGAAYITRGSEAALSNETALSGLATGVLVNTTGTGALSIKSANTCTNQFPRSDNASGAWTCASIATADLPTVPVTKGGTGLTTVASNQVWVGTAADTVTAKTIPSCSNATTSKLLYDNATQTFSCGTDQNSGGGLTVQTARTTGTHTVGSTTATEVTALQVSLAGAGTYDVRYNLRVRSSSATNGYKFGVNVTANLSSLNCVASHATSGTTAANGTGDGTAAVLTGSLIEALGATNAASTTAANMGPNTGVTGTTDTVQVIITCSVVTSGAGDLELWMGSEAAVNVTTEANSYVIVTTIP